MWENPKIQKLKLWQHLKFDQSKPQIVRKLKEKNGDKNQKLKLWQKVKT